MWWSTYLAEIVLGRSHYHNHAADGPSASLVTKHDSAVFRVVSHVTYIILFTG